MRLLIIDDDIDLRRFLKDSLTTNGFIVDTSGDGIDGSYMARIHEYDAILLDYIIPGKNGMEVLKNIRSVGKTTPVIMLSVQGEIDDKAKLLDLGADDYMTKPFSYKELISRIRALIRRPKQMTSSTLKIKNLVIDTINHKVSRGLKEIHLTRKEFALAEYLMRSQGLIVSKGVLTEHVWNSEIDRSSNTIEVHMGNLRKKIDNGYDTKLIHTVPGRGYKIDAHRKIFK